MTLAKERKGPHRTRSGPWPASIKGGWERSGGTVPYAPVTKRLRQRRVKGRRELSEFRQRQAVRLRSGQAPTAFRGAGETAGGVRRRVGFGRREIKKQGRPLRNTRAARSFIRD